MPRGAKRGSQGKRYTDARRKKILATAKRERLTGAQVAERFGVSTLTFYRWRGPVRSDAVARRGKRGPGRPKGSGKSNVDNASVRREVRAQIRKVLPQIIREEVATSLKAILRG